MVRPCEVFDLISLVVVLEGQERKKTWISFRVKLIVRKSHCSSTGSPWNACR